MNHVQPDKSGTKIFVFNKKMYLKAFVIGSSILSTVWSEWYMGKNYDEAGCPCDLTFFGNKNIKFYLYPIIVPILYGLFNVLNVFLQSQFPDVNEWLVAAGVGALFGFLLSVVGRFGFDFPRRVFGFKTQREQASVHWMAPIFYGVVFAVIVQSLNRLV